MRKRLTLIVIVTLIAVAGAGAYMLLRISRPRTVADAVAKYGAAARARIEPHFARAGVTYPPRRIALLVFKKERRVAVWADQHFIRDYPILAASGHAGPKLREGDYQVPEGVYRIEWLNPNSSYHLSMKVSYPNDFDRRMAARYRLSRLGGDIFIHGRYVSIGCIALGDRAIDAPIPSKAHRMRLGR